MDKFVQDGRLEEIIERLKTEHAALEARLNEIESHISLTPAEQMERSRIKKLKLAKKDLINQLKHEQH